jgi:hypothetical protein
VPLDGHGTTRNDSVTRFPLAITAVLATAISLVLVFSVAGTNRSAAPAVGGGHVVGVISAPPSSIAMSQDRIAWSTPGSGGVPQFYVSTLGHFRPQHVGSGIRLRGQPGTLGKLAISGDWVVWLQTYLPYPGWSIRAVNIRTHRRLSVGSDNWNGGSGYVYPTLALSGPYLLWTRSITKVSHSSLIPWNNIQMTDLETGVRLGISSGEYCQQVNAVWAAATEAVWAVSDICTPDRILIVTQAISIPKPGTPVHVSKRITHRTVVGLLASQGGIEPPDGAKVPTSFAGNGYNIAWIVPYGPLSPGTMEIYDPHKVRLNVPPQTVAGTFALGRRTLIWTRPGASVIANDLTNGDEIPLLLLPVRPVTYPLAPVAAWDNRVAWVQPRSRSPRVGGYLLETYIVR